VAENVFDFEVRLIDGRVLSLGDLRGTVLLIVNTASECGFTPQYEGLEQLQQDYAERGFTVIGFPCNQFRAQEPGDAAQINAFCTKNFGVTFPISEKIAVKGADAHPLFRHLTTKAPGLLGTQVVKWNFTKFLVDPAGRVVARFAPFTKPDKIAGAIEALLPDRSKGMKQAPR
jgi:glutathione peroxidase